MTDGDPPVRGALGPRGAHIIGPQGLEQGGPGHARHRTDEHRTECHGRQDDAEEARETPDRAIAPLKGQQAGTADILDQQQAHPEDRDGHAHDGERHDGPVDQRAAAPGGEGPQGDAERHRPEQAGEHQFDGRPEGERDLVDHGTVGDHRPAEVELQHAAEITAELDPERLVEAELLADRVDFGLGGGRAGDDDCRIRRHDLQQQEADQQNAQQHRERNHQSLGDMSRHSC